MQSTIFETLNFTIRELHFEDITPYHQMQGNSRVMQYTTGKANTLEEDQVGLHKVISHYSETSNQFWVWAVERKIDKAFVGTCALIGNNKGVYEIGFRFLEQYWNLRYGKEICNGLTDYAFCQEEVTSLIAYVDIRNIGSVKILEQSNLGFIKEVHNTELGSTDRYYSMEIIDQKETVHSQEKSDFIPNRGIDKNTPLFS